MEEFNILTDLYLPKVKQDNILSSNEYKHLNENNIDTADIEGVEKDHDAGEIVFDVDKQISEEENSIFLKDVFDLQIPVTTDDVIFPVPTNPSFITVISILNY